MSGAVQLHPLPEAAHTLGVEGFKSHAAHQVHIRRPDSRIPHHGLILLVCTAVITLAVSAIGVAGVIVNIHRLVGPIRTGDFDNDDVVAANLFHIHIFFGQDIDTDFHGIVDDVPKFTDQAVGIGQIYGIEGLVRCLDNAQQDDAAQRVSEGGVGLPNALGQTAQGLFGLYAVVFPVLLQAAEIKHRCHLPWRIF